MKAVICHLTNSLGPLRCRSPLRILLGELVLRPVRAEAESVHGELVPGAGGGLGLGQEDQEAAEQGMAGPGHDGGHQLSHPDSNSAGGSLMDSMDTLLSALSSQFSFPGPDLLTGHHCTGVPPLTEAQVSATLGPGVRSRPSLSSLLARARDSLSPAHRVMAWKAWSLLTCAHYYLSGSHL